MSNSRGARAEREREALIQEGQHEAGVAEAMRLYEALYPVRKTQAAIVAAQVPGGSNAAAAAGVPTT